ncbi:MAG: DNA primase [candidate division Zixibacteria bacterium]|nr:DNA primase [candidate division Zixibacteria bacterium]
MIPSEQIERVKQSADIVDIIGSFVKLTRRGRNFVALCPFHSEKTPSFSVSPDKQIYYCFGCGTGGNVFKFIMEHEKMSFVEAVKYLAERTGITIEETQSSSKQSAESTDRLYNANNIAFEYFRLCLDKIEGNTAQKYIKQRKISSSAVEEFGIGYAPDKTSGLIKFANKKGVKTDDLLAAGLVSKTTSGYRDFFRERLIFPIMNLSGRVVAFGGRTLSDGEKAKYINTPETPVFKKGSQLFGLNLSREEIRKKREAIVVEGYTDLISLYSSGIKNVVCSSGTAFTPSQAALLSRFAEKVIILFDSDAAGLKAAGRSVGELLSKGLDSFICVLPRGEDPDSYIKAQGAKSLMELLDEALPYPEFKRMVVGKPFSVLSVNEQDELIMELTEVIYTIDDPLKRRLLTDRMEKVFDFPISAFARKKPSRPGDDTPAKTKTRSKVTLEREFLSLLADNPSRIPEITRSVEPECFSDDGCRMVFVRMIDEYSRYNSVDIDKWVDNDTPRQLLETLASMDESRSLAPTAEEVLDDYVKHFKLLINKNTLRALKEQIIEAESKGDYLKANELQKRYLRILTGAGNR